MTPWVARLIYANVAMFILSMAVPLLGAAFTLVPAYALYRPWTVGTYMFIHGGLVHVLFNMLVLFFFGPRLEDRLGSRNFLWLYFLSGLVAGAVSVITPYLLPAFSPRVGVVGASGAIYGVMLGFARYWPRDRIFIWGIIPVEARWMVAGMTLYALYGIAMEAGGAAQSIAHHAHLGGFLGAFLYLKWRETNSAAAKFKASAEGARRKGWRQDREALERWAKIDREELHEVNREAYDRIATKLEAEGIGSLSDRERAFLDRFSTR
jgi:membrane associated rhomboid family serine protease